MTDKLPKYKSYTPVNSGYGEKKNKTSVSNTSEETVHVKDLLLPEKRQEIEKQLQKQKMEKEQLVSQKHGVENEIHQQREALHNLEKEQVKVSKSLNTEQQIGKQKSQETKKIAQDEVVQKDENKQNEEISIEAAIGKSTEAKNENDEQTAQNKPQNETQNKPQNETQTVVKDSKLEKQEDQQEEQQRQLEKQEPIEQENHQVLKTDEVPNEETALPKRQMTEGLIGMFQHIVVIGSTKDSAKTLANRIDVLCRQNGNIYDMFETSNIANSQKNSNFTLCYWPGEVDVTPQSLVLRQITGGTCSVTIPESYDKLDTSEPIELLID